MVHPHIQPPDSWQNSPTLLPPQTRNRKRHAVQSEKKRNSPSVPCSVKCQRQGRQQGSCHPFTGKKTIRPDSEPAPTLSGKVYCPRAEATLSTEVTYLQLGIRGIDESISQNGVPVLNVGTTGETGRKKNKPFFNSDTILVVSSTTTSCMYVNYPNNYKYLYNIYVLCVSIYSNKVIGNII